MNLIGLDIGSSMIKAVQVQVGRGFKLQKYFSVSSKDIYPKLLSESSSDLDSAAGYLKGLIADNNFVPGPVSIVLPDNKVFTKLINMPALAGEALSNAVKWQAEEHVPYPASDVYLKYSALPGRYVAEEKSIVDIDKDKIIAAIKGKKDEVATASKENTMDVLLVAAPKIAVNKYLRLANKAGLEPVGLEPGSISIIRSESLLDKSSVPTIYVDFGYSSVSFALAVQNTLRFVRTVDFSLKNIIRILKDELDVSDTQAGEYLFSYGLKPHELNGKIKEMITPVVKIIADELVRSKNYVETKEDLMRGAEQQKIRRTVLTGGGSLIPDILIFLAQEVGIEVEAANPLQNLDIKGLERQNGIANISSLFSPAIGAGLKDL